MIQSHLSRPVEARALETAWLPHETDVIVSSLQALLRAESRAEAAAVLQETITHLGGTVVPVTESEAAMATAMSDLPVDVSLGVGEPRAVRLPDDPVTALFLASHLDWIIEDAQAAAHRSDRHQRETLRATTDILTQVASRTEIDAQLGLSAPGDVVCVLDLDNFKLLNDLQGHAAGDAALRLFGSLIRGSIREGDSVGRSGGDEFVVVLRAIPVDTANARMRLLASKWRISGRHSTSVSVGIAVVDPRGGTVASEAADRAMYRAKRAGRGLVEVAVLDDYMQGDQ